MESFAGKLLADTYKSIRSRKRRSSSPMVNPAAGNLDTVQVGDQVCLYDDELMGYIMNYVCSNTFNELVVAPEQHRDFPLIPNVNAVQFEICVPRRYKCSKEAKKLRRQAHDDPTDPNLQTRYQVALKMLEAENRDNEVEHERQLGRSVVYGQVVQLRHVMSCKFVHANPSLTSATEAGNVKIELRADSAKSAYFRILPYSKVKSEGEAINYGDPVVFESVKSPDQYIHCSRSTFGPTVVCSDCNEVNLSVRQSGFTVIASYRPMPKEDTELGSLLCAGSFIRLFHRETESYMSARGLDQNIGTNVHLYKRAIDKTNASTMQPSTSAIHYWQLEKENGILDCDKIRWDEKVKLRHAVTRQYLSVSNGYVTLATAATAEEDMFFYLSPVVKRGDFVSLDTAVRIQHCETSRWLRAYDPSVSDPEQPNGVGSTKSPFDTTIKPLRKSAKKLCAVDEMHYEDAFAVQFVEQEQVKEMNYVAAMVPILLKFYSDIAKGHSDMLTIRHNRPIEAAITELADYLVDNGNPIKRRQKLLRNFMVIDIGVLLLMQRSELLAGNLPMQGMTASSTRAIKEFVSENLEPVFAGAMSLLSAYLNGESRKNELYLGRHMDFILSLVQDASSIIGLMATEMSIHLLSNNKLLVDKFTKPQITRIIELLRQKMNHQQLGLLSALCACNEASLPDNQTHIAIELIEKPTRQKEPVLPILMLGSKIGLAPNATYVSYDGGRNWNELVQVIKSGKRKQRHGSQYQFICQQLKLFVAMCKGRNNYVTELLTTKLQLLSWELCFTCLTNDELDDNVRALFCRLLFELFINVGSNFIDHQDVDLVFLYDETRRPGKNDKEKTEQPLELPFIAPLKQWVRKFILINDSLVASNSGCNMLLAEVLSILPSIVRFGYYDSAEIKAVLVPILGLLESSDDVPFIVGSISEETEEVRLLVADFQERERYVDNWKNASLIAVKIAACKAAELLFNRRTSVRLQCLIAAFKRVFVREQKKSNEFGPLLYATYDFSDDGLNNQIIELIMKMFAANDHFEHTDFTEALVDLCQYENYDLSKYAFYLLTRYYGDFKDVLGSALRSQILLTDASYEVHAVAVQQVRDIRYMLIDGDISQANAVKLREIVDNFSNLCVFGHQQSQISHSINQQILTNTGVLDDVFGIIALGQDASNLYDLIESCFRFLQAMAADNKIVQKLLFERASELLKIGESETLSELFAQIFETNDDLVRQVSVKFIEDVVHQLTITSNPTLISLLNSVLMAGSEPLKRNQQLVVNALLHNKKSIDVVIGRDGAALRAIMTAEKKKSNPGLKLYISNMIQLLSHCCLGATKLVESVCQTLFCIDDLMDIILCKSLSNPVRLPFIYFLHTVFLSNNSLRVNSYRELSHHTKFWMYLSTLTAELQALTKQLQSSSNTFRLPLSKKPVVTKVTNINAAIGTQAEVVYFMDYVLPMLKTFFEHCYQRYDDVALAAPLSDSEEDDGTHAGFVDILKMENDIADELLREGLIPFATTVYPYVVEAQYLNMLYRSLSSIAVCTNSPHQVPTILLDPPKPTSQDPAVQYQLYYHAELQLNASLFAFVQNLQSIYGGENTLRCQIQYPSSAPYNRDDVATLPLSEEFQNLVRSFESKDGSEDQHHRWWRAQCLVQLIDKTQTRREMDGSNNELLISAIQILHSILHNEIVVLETLDPGSQKDYQENRVRELQKALTQMDAVNPALNLLSSDNNGVILASLKFLVTLLYDGNKLVQDRVLDDFLKTREEYLFELVKVMIAQAQEDLKQQSLESKQHAKPLGKMRVKEMVMAAIDGSSMFSSGVTDALLTANRSNAESKSSLFAKLLQLDKNKITGKADAEQADKSDGNLIQRQVMPCTRTDLKHSLRPVDHLRSKILVDEKKGGPNEAWYMPKPGVNRYKRFSDLDLTLKLVASLCDGQHERMQDYLRDQWDNLKSVNLVGELCDFLPSVTGSILTDRRLTTITEIVNTLIELIQGNEANQFSALHHKLFEHVSNILRLSQTTNLNQESVYEMKRSVGILITDMIEENHSSIKTMVGMINRTDLVNQVEQAFDLLMDKEYLLTLGCEDVVLTVGFTYYHVLRRVMDVDPIQEDLEYLQGEAFLYFEAHTQAVEVQKGETLQRLYFAVLDADALRSAVKERVKWEVDRSSASNKLRDFMSWSRDICEDVKYQRKIQSHWLSKTLVQEWSLLNRTFLLLTFLINVMMLAGWVAPERLNPHYEYSVTDGRFMPEVGSISAVAIVVLGALHIVITFLLCVSFVLANQLTYPTWMTRLLTKVRAKWQKQKLYSLSDHSANECNHQSSYLSIPMFSWEGLYYPIMLVLSVLGTLSHGSIYCIHMLHITKQNQLLRRAMLAVTLNGRSMLWVTFLGMLYLYIYAMIGFLFMRQIFTKNGLFCGTLFECFVSVIRNGLVTGMTENFDLPDSASQSFQMYATKAIYDVTFFAVIITIGLNMIFGIIIDTFSQLREAKKQAEDDMNNTCFICGRSSYEFDQHADGFEHHVKTEHNMWSYLFFLLHLAETPPNDMTALELYVHRQVENQTTTFMPLGRALCLMRITDDSLATQIQQIRERLDYLTEQQRTEEQNKERAAAQEARLAKRQLQHQRASATTRKSWFTRRTKKAEEEEARGTHAFYGLHTISWSA